MAGLVVAGAAALDPIPVPVPVPAAVAPLETGRLGLPPRRVKSGFPAVPPPGAGAGIPELDRGDRGRPTTIAPDEARRILVGVSGRWTAGPLLELEVFEVFEVLLEEGVAAEGKAECEVEGRTVEAFDIVKSSEVARW